MGERVTGPRLLRAPLPVHTSSDGKYDADAAADDDAANDANAADDDEKNFTAFNDDNKDNDHNDDDDDDDYDDDQLAAVHSTPNPKTSNHNYCVHPAR